VTKPVRLQLSRRKGFNLQAVSIAVNGLPPLVVARPGLFGNPFAVTSTTDAAAAVSCFRRFLRRWSQTQIMEGAMFEDGESAPIAGLGLIVLRNKIRANIWNLRGHNLACWCKPDAPCHADVYLDVLATDWPERWKRTYPKICDEVR
jgi:hypothetical protein